MKYLCINCKKEFDELPPFAGNECMAGYYHAFVRKSDIININSRRSAPTAREKND